MVLARRLRSCVVRLLPPLLLLYLLVGVVVVVLYGASFKKMGSQEESHAGVFIWASKTPMLFVQLLLWVVGDRRKNRNNLRLDDCGSSHDNGSSTQQLHRTVFFFFPFPLQLSAVLKASSTRACLLLYILGNTPFFPHDAPSTSTRAVRFRPRPNPSSKRTGTQQARTNKIR